MQASILDLRYHMKEILQALERNETVEILYHGKRKGTIIPHIATQKTSTKDHPYFGMATSTKTSNFHLAKFHGCDIMINTLNNNT
jgi:hypothetical protein